MHRSWRCIALTPRHSSLEAPSSRGHQRLAPRQQKLERLVSPREITSRFTARDVALDALLRVLLAPDR